MGASPGVRAATERDIPRLVGLTRLAQDLHVAAHPDVFRPSSDLPGIDDLFSKSISDTNQHVLVAEVDGVAVGYLCATVEREPAHTFKRDTTRLYVQQIAVAADRRRRGVGRALFAAVEQIAQDQSINDIALDTWSFNEEAQDFFASLGFSVYKIKLWKRGHGRTGQAPGSSDFA